MDRGCVKVCPDSVPVGCRSGRTPLSCGSSVAALSNRATAVVRDNVQPAANNGVVWPALVHLTILSSDEKVEIRHFQLRLVPADGTANRSRHVLRQSGRPARPPVVSNTERANIIGPDSTLRQSRSRITGPCLGLTADLYKGRGGLQQASTRITRPTVDPETAPEQHERSGISCRYDVRHAALARRHEHHSPSDRPHGVRSRNRSFPKTLTSQESTKRSRRDSSWKMSVGSSVVRPRRHPSLTPVLLSRTPAFVKAANLCNPELPGKGFPWLIACSTESRSDGR